MSLQWHYTAAGIESTNTPTALPVSLPLGVQTIKRTLVDVTFSGNKFNLDYPDLFTTPVIGVFLGYDKTSSHNGDDMTPFTNPNYDYLYSEWFQPNVFWNNTTSNVYQYAYWGGTNQTRSVEGQRSIISTQRACFVQFVIDNTVIDATQEANFFITCRLRFLLNY